MKSAKIFTYLSPFLTDIESEWLFSKKESNAKDLALSFVVCSRKIDKTVIPIKELLDSFDELWRLENLSKETVARGFLLSLLSENSTSEEEYLKWMNHLFETAEVNEAIALIQFLVVSKNPKLLLHRAKDAVRSNVGTIFDAIAFHNPYPFHYFDEASWNQLVLKCIFNDKPIHFIVGLEERRNQALADTLSDFAHERWAAGRRVPSQVWRLVVPFVNDILIQDITNLIQSNDERDQLAACLVIKEANRAFSVDFKNTYQVLLDKFSSYSWSTLENNEPIYTGQ